MTIVWTEVPTTEPEPRPVCSLGVEGHTWVLSVQEGSVGLRPVESCPAAIEDQRGRVVSTICQEDVFGPVGGEILDGEDLALVKLKFANDGPGPDVNWWVEITPAVVEY